MATPISAVDFANWQGPNAAAFNSYGTGTGDQFGTGIAGLTMPQEGWDFSNLLGAFGGGAGGEGGFGSLQGWGGVAGGIGSLVGAWNGMQQNKLAREQFGFSKDMANRNLANQAAVTNQALRDRRGGRRAVFGGNEGTGAQVSGAAI